MLPQLVSLLIAVVVGAAVGLYFRSRHKEGCKQFGNWALSLDWRIYAVEVVMFGLIAAFHLYDGNYVLGAASLALTTLAVVVTCMQLRKQRTPKADKPTA
ncbi:MAG: hypothetical protein QM775_21640 [Pirellulales bacterium]